MTTGASTDPRKEMPPPPRNIELIDRWLSFKVHNDGCSPRTERAYRDALNRLVTFLEYKPLIETTTDDLVLFSGVWLHKQGVDAISRRPHISAVREFFKWLTARREIDHNPALDISYPRIGRKLPALMTLQSAERLMWAPDMSTFPGVRDASILSLLMGCGFRVSGLTSLNDSNIVHSDNAGDLRMVIKVKEKGDKQRLVPVPKDAEMLLRLYMAHPDLAEIDRTIDDGDRVLFVSLMNRNVPEHEYRGERRRMSAWSVRDMIKRYGEKVGVPAGQLHPHAARHLFGTELAESDVDMLTRQELMGHADAKSTKIYTHLAMRKKIQESDRANPLAKMKTPVSDLMKRLGSTR